MSDTHLAARSLSTLAALGLLLGAGACAHVNQDELDARMTAMRADLTEQMEEGDRAVADRLDGRISDVETRLAALEEELEALEGEFDLTVERLETAIRFNTPIHFGFDEAELEGEAFAILDRFGDVVTGYYPNALITVEGFTDPAGSAEYNLRLGKKRAEAVKEYLVMEAGMADGRIRTVSYGESGDRTVADGATGPGESGRENRRVVLVIDHNGEQPEIVARTGLEPVSDVPR